jgi:hypothetical protein
MELYSCSRPRHPAKDVSLARVEYGAFRAIRMIMITLRPHAPESIILVDPSALRVGDGVGRIKENRSTILMTGARPVNDESYRG